MLFPHEHCLFGGDGVLRLARMVWSTFFHVCLFDRGSGVNAFMEATYFKKGHPLPNGWEGSVVGGRVTGGDAPVWEI